MFEQKRVFAVYPRSERNQSALLSGLHMLYDWRSYLSKYPIATEGALDFRGHGELVCR